MEEFVTLASALLINIGTLSTPWIRSMHKAAAKAQELGKPWVLDPVGAGATSLRTNTATDLVVSYKPTELLDCKNPGTKEKIYKPPKVR